MSIDRQKPSNLVSILLAAALGVSTGCGNPVGPEGSNNKQSTSGPAIMTPEVCGSPAEFLRPPTLDIESVATYPGGIIVNRAGEALDLVARVPNLIRIKSEVSLGLNFTPDTQNITYFFSGSFKRPDARERIAEFIEQDRMYLLIRYCQEQGISSGRIRYSLISVEDELTYVIRRNRRNYSARDDFWKTALEVQLALSYTARTKATSFELNQVPLETPNLSAQERGIVVRGLPFSITRLNPDYVFPILQDDTIGA